MGGILKTIDDNITCSLTEWWWSVSYMNAKTFVQKGKPLHLPLFIKEDLFIERTD